MSPKSEVGAWMKLYPADWLAGTRMLPPMARAAFIDLLCYGWENEGIPDDPARLARFCGMTLEEFAPAWEALRSKFEVRKLPDGGLVLVNPKQERVREEQLGASAKRAEWRERKQRQRDRERDVTRDTPRDNRVGLRTQDSGSPSEKEARKPRRDGHSELRAALEGRGASSDLAAAAEAYRKRRQKNRHPLWDSDQWAKLFGTWSDAELIRALEIAEQTGWQSVHPKPLQPARPLSGTAQSFANLESLDRKLRERGVVVKDEPWRGNPGARCLHLERKLSNQKAEIRALTLQRDALRDLLNEVRPRQTEAGIEGTIPNTWLIRVGVVLNMDWAKEIELLLRGRL